MFNKTKAHNNFLLLQPVRIESRFVTFYYISGVLYIGRNIQKILLRVSLFLITVSIQLYLGYGVCAKNFW